MKVSLLRLGIVTALATGLFYGEASAESVKVIGGASSENTYYENPSHSEINKMLTVAALKADIPPEVVKAIAMEESGWKQFENGKPLISEEDAKGSKGIGIMQVTDYDPAEEKELKYNIEYNIQRGIDILNSKYKLIAAGEIPGIKGADRHVLENWYFPVMAYNGIKPTNSPLVQADGTINEKAYQYKVFVEMEKGSFLDIPKGKEEVYDLLATFPFTREDFQYNPASTENIKFLKKEYTVDNTHDSAYFFKATDWVKVTGADKVRVRDINDPSKVKFQVDNNAKLKITGTFKYYNNATSRNQFVWYPIETQDGQTGYISSAYLKEELINNTGVVPSLKGTEPKYQEAVSFLLSKGIKGKEDGTFGTQDHIIRGDAAVLVARALGLDVNGAPNSSFTDVPNRAKKEVNALKAAGITDGKTDKTFGFDEKITRGQLAIWLQRAYELEVGKTKLPFTDVADRYKNAVSALVNYDITSGTSATSFGTTNPAKRGDFALFLYKAHVATDTDILD